ncbi:hypothetical protein [Effusibacillus pohliae]|uniref:hypothetical protein n=1 Tax=Effusibacillus pohliae TaxID=232270 RepID=UPI001FDF526D|nr:hypothetical protein [Effusibacillus pohliae]
MARRTKLTPEIQQKIVGAIAAGNYHETACALAGIHPSTFYRWLEEGAKPRAKKGYREFCEAVKKAEAAAEAKRIQLITKAAETDWKAAAWYLERKYPDRWGKKDKVSAEVEHSGTVVNREEYEISIRQQIVADPESRELVKQLWRRQIALAGIDPGDSED